MVRCLYHLNGVMAHCEDRALDSRRAPARRASLILRHIAFFAANFLTVAKPPGVRTMRSSRRLHCFQNMERQVGSKQNQERSQTWIRWVDRHRLELLKCGLPPILREDRAAWVYFLEHGGLSDGFGIWSGWRPSMLSPSQAKAFHNFLTSDALKDDGSIDGGILRELQEVIDKAHQS